MQIAAETSRALTKSGFELYGKVWLKRLAEDRAIVVDHVGSTKNRRAIVKNHTGCKEVEAKLLKEMKRTNGGRAITLVERMVEVRSDGHVSLGPAIEAKKPEEPAEKKETDVAVTGTAVDREFMTVPSRADIEWEVVENTAEAHRRLPIIGLHQRPGDAMEVSLNGRALEKLGNPEYVRVQVSKKGDAIALSPTTASDFNAFKVSGNKRFTSSLLAKKLGFDPNATKNVRMEGMTDGDMLVGILNE